MILCSLRNVLYDCSLLISINEKKVLKNIYIIGKLHMHYVVLNTQSHPPLTLVGEGSTIWVSAYWQFSSEM